MCLYIKKVLGGPEAQGVMREHRAWHHNLRMAKGLSLESGLSAYPAPPLSLLTWAVVEPLSSEGCCADQMTVS